MKLRLQVSGVSSSTGKPTDRTNLLPVVWEVRMLTEPHMGDLVLSSSSPEFAAWAAQLTANDFVEADFNREPPEIQEAIIAAAKQKTEKRPQKPRSQNETDATND